jgi:hypothetical protein
MMRNAYGSYLYGELLTNRAHLTLDFLYMNQFLKCNNAPTSLKILDGHPQKNRDQIVTKYFTPDRIIVLIGINGFRTTH